jgi:hypothetical protein
MTTKTLLQILALAWAALFFLVPAHAETTASTVCKVQDAIRFRSPPWTETQCYRVANALNRAAAATDQKSEILLSIAIVESDLRPEAHVQYGTFSDEGLMGVQCRAVVHGGRCTNWPVKGLLPAQVRRVETNVLAGAKILAAKPKLNDYNGGKGYAEKVYAVAGALAGVRTKSPVKRIRKLIWQILNGLGFERTT